RRRRKFLAQADLGRESPRNAPAAAGVDRPGGAGRGATPLKSNWILASTLFVGTLVLDAVTKALALAHLADGPIFLGADWLALRLAFNEGVAFSFLEGIPYWMLGAGAIVLLALVLWNLRDLLASRIGASALGLVAAGGLG